MDSFMSLKQFTSCVSGKKTSAKRVPNRSQSVRRNSLARRRSISRRRSVPCNSQKVQDSWLRVYQAELKKERKRQQDLLAKKNSSGSVRTAHFRSHHCLPRQTTNVRKPVASSSAKDASFFGAFQGLSLDELLGGTNGSPSVAAPSAAGGDQCKVM